MGKTKRFKKIMDRITGGAAAAVDWYDKSQLKLDRHILILRYRFAKRIHEDRKKLIVKKKSIMLHFAGFVLVAVGVVAVFNYATGFQYAYNGKVLGYVRNQEDVVKLLDMVSAELSEEYGSKIKIDAEENITFRNVVILDKEVDDIDTVLKRLTYMSDMEAEGYGIYIDNRYFVTCESEDAAEATLKSIQQKYMKDDKRTTYIDSGFKEKVEVKPVSTKLAYISNTKEAKDKIMTGGSAEITYTVKGGDTYSEICKEFDMDFEELKETNPDISMDSLFVGDELLISEAVPAVTVVTTEKKTYAEKVKYKTEVRKDDSLYENVEKVIQKGSDGKRVVTAKISRENGKETKKEILKSKTITKPVKKIVVKGTKKLPKTAPTGTFIMPVSGYTLTSEFGWRWGRNHDGLDLACGTGTPIYASDGGTVVYAGWYSGYGLFVEIDHGSGIRTRYGHCNSIDVSVGDKVYQGQKIAEVGNTGNSFGSHCHFEIVVNGTPVDPFKYL